MALKDAEMHAVSLVGSIRRLIIFMVVVCRIPRGRTSTTVSPASMSSESSRRASAAAFGNRLVTRWSEIMTRDNDDPHDRLRRRTARDESRVPP